jgi:hypothetical protein
MGYLVIGLLLGFPSAFIAKKKGRDFGRWLTYGILVWPIALIHSLLLKPGQNVIEKVLVSEGNKECPHCAEIIKQEARVCSHCGRDTIGLDLRESIKKCPYCGTENKDEAFRCKNENRSEILPQN